MEAEKWREKFLALGEVYAAALFETPEKGMFYRNALAYRRYLENRPPLPYAGGRLYPGGYLARPYAVYPWYMGVGLDENGLNRKEAGLAEAFRQTPFFAYHSHVYFENTVAGNMWTHSMPAYERVLREGLDGYAARVERMKEPELREGLCELLAGIRAFLARSIAYLREGGADARLIAALSRVPMQPARNFYEAMVCWNVLFYLDGCDNPGPLAAGVYPYYDSTTPGAEEEAEELFSEFFGNVDANDGYSLALGMMPTPLDAAAIRAVRGRRRPMVELFVDENTAPDVWQAALSSILDGSGQPAIYNKTRLRDGLLQKIPQLTPEDVLHFCGGGCTESMISGCSCVGSIDAGVHLPLAFSRAMKKYLPTAKSFEEFYEKTLSDMREVTIKTLREVSESQEDRRAHVHVPMRTLLVDDCIEKEREYYDEGARYSWSIINFAGLPNVIDDFMAVKELVFDGQEMSGEELLAQLEREDPAFMHALRTARRRFGVDDAEVNAFSRRFSEEVLSFADLEKPAVGLLFLPCSIQFRAYDLVGKWVGATPDGRYAEEPIADSLTALFSRDIKGATALFRSITSLALDRMLGIPVVNFSVSPHIGADVLRALIEGYLALGGIQMQISCLSREVLEKAMEHPDEYRNLVVRVGGYSEYFYRLTPEIKRKVLERTIYGAGA